MNIDCLIPAAGLSSRMDKWKLLLPYKTSTIIETSISNALKVCSRVILVTGYRGEELDNLLAPSLKIITIRNTNFGRGMFSSIQTGAKLIESEWFFITMGDMPHIDGEIFRTLLLCTNNNKKYSKENYDIIRPVYHGKRGHPVLLHRNTIESILTEHYTSEMKNVLLRHKVLDLPMELPGTFMDIDTPEDYKKSTKIN